MDRSFLLDAPARTWCRSLRQSHRGSDQETQPSGVQHFKQVTTETRPELRNRRHILVLESILLVLEQLLPVMYASQSMCLAQSKNLQIHFDRFAKILISEDRVLFEDHVSIKVCRSKVSVG